MEHVKEIGRALRCIADELDQDQRIQRLVQPVEALLINKFVSV